MQSPPGKTALVTGASRGIGRAIALALAGAGHRVIVHYCSNESGADATVAEIRNAGGRAEKIQTDLGRTDGPHQLAGQVIGLLDERLDVLVANAAVGTTGSIEATTVRDFDELFAVNVRAPFFLVQQLLPVLRTGSAVVFVSSLAASSSGTDIHAYAATKGAINTLVKHFAAALGPRGVRVNAIAPGIVETDMARFTKTEAGRRTALDMQSLQKLAQPKDVAPVVAFLASQEAGWITGDVLRIDGGSKL
jgi:3-oxoacyl-[acyl-carrier protein] reductase